MDETVKSPLDMVLQKMTAWVMVSVSYKSHNVSNFQSCVVDVLVMVVTVGE